MDIRNCQRCGRLFSYTGAKICPTCRRQEEEDFEKVKQYLRKNPASSLDEVHEATGVDRDVILEFIREGRLEAKGTGFALTCRICGKPIRVGSICDACARELSPPGARRQSTGESRTRERMYTADLLRNKSDLRRK